MYTNNLILDYGNKIKIPQNYEIFFEIGLSDKFKDSIEIKIHPYREIDILNLYIIIKSYVSNLIFIPSNFMIIINNRDNEKFIAANINIGDFKNMTVNTFSRWFYKQLHKDWEYIKKEGEYSFILTYPIKIYDESSLKYLIPDYPWKSEIMHKMIGLLQSEITYENIIERQKKEIENLKEKITELKSRK